ncbi:MAG: HlyD family efflux transporter periplasmic adaptor subunit [Lentisphaerae bacterium]|nr:HlyD family efflux transporter periplasmic adaptor subunit [Lentisphaerota bacterium]
MKLTRKKLFIFAGILLLIAGCCGVYFGVYLPRKNAAQASDKKTENNDDMDRTFKVRRDDLVIGLQQGGYINASKKHKLALQANHRTKLIWVIDENTKIKKGDLLAKFETDDLLEKIENFEIEQDNLSKELDLAKENYRVILSENAAALQDAEEKLSQADDALRKYRRFERINKRDSLELAITEAEDALKTEEDTYREARDKQYEATSTQNAEEVRQAALDKQQAKIDKAENALSNAEDNFKVFRRYDHPSQLLRLVNAYDQAKLTLQKVRISTESKAIQQRKSMENLRRRVRWVTKQLERYKEYMPMMEWRAPEDGVVIYGDPDRRWGNIDVKLGIEVGRGQVLITIPEMSNLVVDFDLPEQFRSKVQVGNKATITPDSLPGEKFEATISHIATLPVNMVSWDSASPKIYKTKLKLNKQSSKLVNGMSVQIHVVTKVIPKVLFVPIEAVFEENDRFFVYRSGLGGPQEVTVEIGESNDNFVQIKSGLKEDDVVYLYRPYQKSQDGK